MTFQVFSFFNFFLLFFFSCLFFLFFAFLLFVAFYFCFFFWRWGIFLASGYEFYVEHWSFFWKVLPFFPYHILLQILLSFGILIYLLKRMNIRDNYIFDFLKCLLKVKRACACFMFVKLLFVYFWCVYDPRMYH